MDKERLWTKDFITVLVINFLAYLVLYSLIVCIASYVVDKFHASANMAGLVAGIFIIGALIGRLGAGRIIEDKGSKKVLLVGAIFFILTSALYFATISLSLLTITRILHGIAYGAISTATGTILAKILPHGRRGEGIAYYSMSAVLAMAFGPFIGILLIQQTDFKIIFMVALILAILIFAISFIVSEIPSKSPKQYEVKAVKSFHISNFIELKAMPISIIGLSIGFCYSVMLTFIPLYTKQIHLDEAASFFFIVHAVAIFFSQPFFGRLFDVKGANFVVYPCLIILAIGMLLLGQINHGITLLLAGAIIGLGYGNFVSCGQAIAIKEVPPHRLGLATATYFMLLDLGIGIGPYLLGSLVPFLGYRGLYSIMSVMILATIPLYYFLHGRKVSLE